MADPILVVVPTRDRPALLAEALASVLAQDDPDWVCAVADDGDGAPIRERLPRALLEEGRLGFCRGRTKTSGGARNAAIAFGEGSLLGRPPTLLAFLDDDDLWEPSHLRRARAALEARPDAAFCHGAARTRAASGETDYHARERGSLEGEVFARLLRRNFVATSTVLARAAHVRAVGGFREDLAHGQDLDLWLKLARRGPAVFVPTPTVVYRAHEGNVSHRLARKVEGQAEALAWWWARRGELPSRTQRILRRELARRRRRHVGRLLDAGLLDRPAVRAVARAAWREVPHLHTARALLEARWARRGSGAARAKGG